MTDPADCGACGNRPAGTDQQSAMVGVCTAPPLACVLTETNCGGVCVNLSGDPEQAAAHVAASAPAGGLPGRGVCSAPRIACVLTETNCGGVCVNLSSDPNNCGARVTLPGRSMHQWGVCRFDHDPDHARRSFDPGHTRRSEHTRRSG